MRAAGALPHTRASARARGLHPASPAARPAASAASTTAGAGDESKRLQGPSAAGAMAVADAATVAAGVDSAALRVARRARPTRVVTGGRQSADGGGGGGVPAAGAPTVEPAHAGEVGRVGPPTSRAAAPHRRLG